MTAPRPAPKPWIDTIHAYVPGRAGDGARPLVKLSANENPLGTAPAALAALAQPADPARYPDPDAHALRRAIGGVHGIDPARIVCAAGSGDLLGLAAQAFAGPGDEIVHVRYGFSLYEIATRRAGATPVVAPDADYGTNTDALLACVTERTRVIFLANPNNPTGSHMEAGALADLHARLPGDVLLVLDQAYAEYVAPGHEDGGLALAAGANNVLVTRTFSKAYGLAGARIGWATGAPPLVEALNRIRGPFNVGTQAQAGAIAALGDQGFVTASRDHTLHERTRFAAALEPLGNRGVRAVPSQANFVLVTFADEAQATAARDAIAVAGYAVRHLPGQGLPAALRITIGLGAQMDGIAAAIAQAVRA